MYYVSGNWKILFSYKSIRRKTEATTANTIFPI